MADGMVDIKVNKRQLAEVQRLLRDVPKKMPQVMSAAINKTAAKGKTLIAKRIAQEMRIKQAAIKKSITIDKAGRRYWLATIKNKGEAIALIHFVTNPRDKRPHPRHPPPIGVTVQIWQQGARKVIPHAFIAKMPSGHIGVFMRQGRKWRRGKREKIRELWGPGIADILTSVQGPIRDIMSQTEHDLQLQILSQIDRVLKRVKRT